MQLKKNAVNLDRVAGDVHPVHMGAHGVAMAYVWKEDALEIRYTCVLVTGISVHCDVCVFVVLNLKTEYWFGLCVIF